MVCSAHTWGSAYRPVPVILTMMCPHMELPVGEAASGWWEGKGWPLIFQDKAPGMRAALKRPECVACPLSSPQLCLSSGFKIKSFPQVKLANWKPSALSRTIKKHKQRKSYVQHRESLMLALLVGTSHLFIYFESLLFCIGVQLINNVVIISGGRQRDSIIHIHVSPPTPLPSRLSYNFEQSSLCYIYSRTLLAVHFEYSSSVQVDPELPNYLLP